MSTKKPTGHKPTLAEQLTAAIGAQGPKPCKLCVAMESMEALDREAMWAALSTKKNGRHAVSVPTLYSILKDSGYDVPRTHIKVHRQEHS